MDDALPSLAYINAYAWWVIGKVGRTQRMPGGVLCWKVSCAECGLRFAQVASCELPRLKKN